MKPIDMEKNASDMTSYLFDKQHLTLLYMGNAKILTGDMAIS